VSEVLVIGHRNPDTDAICSAIGYAEFKRRTGLAEAVAARCGDTNDRIDFVLKTFGVEPPRFVADVSPKVRDVMGRNLVNVLPDTPIVEALATMDENNIRVLPVLDENKRCEGMVSVFKISQFYLPGMHRLFESRRVLSSIVGLTRSLGATVVNAVKPRVEEDLILMIGAMSLDSFRERLLTYAPEKLVVVVGDREDIQQLAIEHRVRCLVVTGGLEVTAGLEALAKRFDVSLLISPHDSATTAMLCRAAITVHHVLDDEFATFRDDELLRNAARIAVEKPYPAFPVLNEHDEVVGILSKSDFLKKVDRKLILVDHNELSQAVNGADEVEILEIIDHHRIGALSTQQPIYFLNDPVGSTSTIVADCFFRSGVELPKPIAGLLLAGLVSDTLNLTSPTTTPRDAAVLKRLETISEVNAAGFTEKLFSSGSILISKPADQAITADCKEYVERGRRFSVAQIEEVGFDNFWKCKSEVLAALENYRMRRDYFISTLLVTDVTEQDSLLLVAGNRDFLGLIDYPEVEPGIYELDNVVSRKKQLLPYLTHCLQRVKGG
jgi:manganese-dependent inorganic pyrophosphatase